MRVTSVIPFLKMGPDLGLLLPYADCTLCQGIREWNLTEVNRDSVVLIFPKY